MGCPPTKSPTVNPTQSPTESTSNPTEMTSNPTSDTLSPTIAPTNLPTFGQQECTDIYVIDYDDDNEIIDANYTLSDVTFKITDYVGINDHLYWDSDPTEQSNNSDYRLYWDSS